MDHEHINREFACMIQSLYPVKTQHQLVRIGGDGDGGYLLPDDFDGVKACFSPGVGHVATFEMHLQNQYNIGSHMMDSTVRRVPHGVNPLSFKRQLLGNKDDDVYTRLDTWIQQCEGDCDQEFVLQMDIEGAEFDVINAVDADTLKRFRMMAVEVHRSEQWVWPENFLKIQQFFNTLTEHFHVVHVHPNNCTPVDQDVAGLKVPRVFEISLLRKDRAQVLGYCQQFPHPLDRINVPANPLLVLSKHLYYPGAAT